MLAEFVHKLQEIILASKKTEVVELDGFPDRVWVNGKETVIPPPRRTAKFFGLEDLARAIAEMSPGSAEAYVSSGEIAVFLDAGERRSAVKMELKATDRMALIIDTEQRKLVATPAVAARWLREELGGAGLRTEAAAAALSTVKFISAGSAGARVKHGEASLGRSVEHALTDADKVPETFEVPVQIWSNLGLRSIEVSIAMGIYIDPEAERVEIRVLPDQLTPAIAAGVDQAATLLCEAAVGNTVLDVYCGTP